jgi:hypothetical protein
VTVALEMQNKEQDDDVLLVEQVFSNKKAEEYLDARRVDLVRIQEDLRKSRNKIVDEMSQYGFTSAAEVENTAFVEEIQSLVNRTGNKLEELIRNFDVAFDEFQQEGLDEDDFRQMYDFLTYCCDQFDGIVIRLDEFGIERSCKISMACQDIKMKQQKNLYMLPSMVAEREKAEIQEQISAERKALDEEREALQKKVEEREALEAELEARKRGDSAEQVSLAKSYELEIEKIDHEQDELIGQRNTVKEQANLIQRELVGLSGVALIKKGVLQKQFDEVNSKVNELNEKILGITYKKEQLEKEKVQKLKGLEAGNGEIENQLDRMQQEIDELRKALEDKERAITEREKGESIAIA